MKSSLSRMVSPTVLLYLFLIVTQIGQGFYSASHVEPAPAFALIHRVALLWILGWWWISDIRKRRTAWFFDMGFFLTIAWPIVMPYYLLKSRRAKGVLAILSFIGAYLGAELIGVMLYALTSFQR